MITLCFSSHNLEASFCPAFPAPTITTPHNVSYLDGVYTLLFEDINIKKLDRLLLIVDIIKNNTNIKFS